MALGGSHWQTVSACGLQPALWLWPWFCPTCQPVDWSETEPLACPGRQPPSAAPPCRLRPQAAAKKGARVDGLRGAVQPLLVRSRPRPLDARDRRGRDAEKILLANESRHSCADTNKAAVRVGVRCLRCKHPGHARSSASTARPPLPGRRASRVMQDAQLNVGLGDSAGGARGLRHRAWAGCRRGRGYEAQAAHAARLGFRLGRASSASRLGQVAWRRIGAQGSQRHDHAQRSQGLLLRRIV